MPPRDRAGIPDAPPVRRDDGDGERRRRRLLRRPAVPHRRLHPVHRRAGAVRPRRPGQPAGREPRAAAPQTTRTGPGAGDQPARPAAGRDRRRPHRRRGRRTGRPPSSNCTSRVRASRGSSTSSTSSSRSSIDWCAWMPVGSSPTANRHWSCATPSWSTPTWERRKHERRSCATGTGMSAAAGRPARRAARAADGGPGGLALGAGRRGPRARRRQRRGEDDAAAHRRRRASGCQRLDPLRRRRHQRVWRRTGGSRAAWRSYPRGGSCSRN